MVFVKIEKAGSIFVFLYNCVFVCIVTRGAANASVWQV